MSKNQKFVAATAAGTIPTDEAILEFCAEPKSRAEINEHFGLSSWDSWTHIPPLVDNGKLHLTIPSIGASSRRTVYAARRLRSLSLITPGGSFCPRPR